MRDEQKQTPQDVCGEANLLGVTMGLRDNDFLYEHSKKIFPEKQENLVMF